jgi:hypothetical protein
MADAEHKNKVVDGSMWDATGQEWTTKLTRFATAKQASGFVGREDPVGLVDAPGKPVRWMGAQDSQQWWTHARHHFDVPDKAIAEPDDKNRTWSAHIWERGKDRLLVFETNV